MAKPTKRPYFLAIKHDKQKSTKTSTVYPIQCIGLAGVSIHARTATYNYETNEPSFMQGQILNLDEETIARVKREAASEWVIQWHRTEGGWRSELVRKSSSMYETLATERDPETNLVTQEEVPLDFYIEVRPHFDASLPAAPAPAADTGELANATGIEAEEAAANPNENAAVKRDQKLRKKFGAEAVPASD